MPKIQSSIRASLGLTVLAMGLLGILLAMATSETYQRLALDNQREFFLAQAKLNIQEIIENVVQDSMELGHNAQASPDFHQAVINKDPTRIRSQLDEHFHHAFVTFGRVKLAKMYVYDKELRLIAASNEGDPTLPGNKPICTEVLSKITHRNKTTHLKPNSELCRVGMRSVLATLVPIGGLHVKGYLQMIIDPTSNFAKADSRLGTPLKLAGPDKTLYYQSANWPKRLSKNILLAKYNLFTPQNQPFFDLTFASNITELRKQLSATRNFIFFIATIIMLSTMLIALFMLQHTALNPLSTLTHHLRRIKEDKSQLGKKVIVNGNREIVELATDFNTMSSEISTLYRTLESMAFTDALTGMPNRILFYDRLEQITATASCYKTQFALMMMDLNRFKNINDTLGHHIGDRLLKIVSERLQTVLRESDTVARLGGDEFAALLPIVDHDEGASIVAEKIVNVLNKPITIEEHHLSISISIGLVRCPRDGDKATLLMQHADVAMYHAKREGLGYVFYDKSMDSENLFELTMESELRQAIGNKDFELYYQPKIDLQHGHIAGAEALIRWEHDEHGFISPEKFIPLAEQTRLIQPLTEWVLEQALTQCAAWHANNINIGVSVNLSAYSLNDIDLIDTVHHALAEAEMEPQWLTLELTETAIMSDANRALNTLSQLNAMGVRLSIDDFGTGYSSLAYLKRFPVDEIKIDKSFVIDMLNDVSDAVIVRSTIDLAHNMGMNVVAEGIESQDVWDKLAELGCNLGQGYHMCRPCPAVAFKEWVYKSSWGLHHIKKAVG